MLSGDGGAIEILPRESEEMKRSGKKVVSLSEHKSMMETLKVLYGNDEVKDDIKGSDSKRESGTKGTSGLAKLPPNCS